MSRRDEVLAAALDLLDEVGLDALTTRRLADKLGVRPGALYRHFDSKHALLSAMVTELIAAPTGDTPTEPGWEGMMRVAATGARAGMLTRRDGARLVVTHVASNSDGQRLWTEFLRLLHESGLPEEAALLAVDTVFAYVNGFTIEEQTRDGFPPTKRRRGERDATFAAGLELIIGGVRARLSAAAGW